MNENEYLWITEGYDGWYAGAMVASLRRQVQLQAKKGERPMRMKKKTPEKKESGVPEYLSGTTLVLPPSAGIDWTYRLERDGLAVTIECKQPGKNTIAITNVLPWDAFIQGLALGWKTYHQENLEFARLIDEFIRKQIAAGKYSPEKEENT